MRSISWLKEKIYQEWERNLPDRFDPSRAAEDKVDENGRITNYENSYAMHHQIVEATAEETGQLFDRYERAEQGLIAWDEERQELYEISDQGGDNNR